jgi:N-acetylglucosaminyldiphosphoundecaprenol N-acetyl-beta-D-mannosaminyltransferase
MSPLENEAFRLGPARAAQVRFFGAKLTPATASEVANIVTEPTNRPTLILNHNLHSLYLSEKFTWFRQLYADAAVVLIDGWPILRLAVSTTGTRYGNEFRIGSTDWLAQLVRSAPGAELRIYLLGGSKESNSAAQRQMRRDLSNADISGRDGYFDATSPDEVAGVIDALRAFKPDLVLVGMGMPRQERFLRDHRTALPAAYYATVGGAIDYVGGTNKLAPRFLGRIGLEWFRRYCIEPFQLIALRVVRDIRPGDRS